MTNVRSRHLKISTFQTETFQKPVFGIQECRNLHVGLSTDIRQAFRGSFFTNYVIMLYMHTSQAVLGMICLLLRLLWLLDTAPSDFSSESTWLLIQQSVWFGESLGKSVWFGESLGMLTEQLPGAFDVILGACADFE